MRLTDLEVADLYQVLPPLSGGLHCGHVSHLSGLFVAVQHGSQTGLAAPGGRGAGTESPRPSLRQVGGCRARAAALAQPPRGTD